MIEVNTAFGKVLLNINAIFCVERREEQGFNVLIVNDKAIPFDSKGERDYVYDLIKDPPS